MTALEAIRQAAFAAALLAVVTLVTVGAATHARASTGTDTRAALSKHPEGGYGLEADILAILDAAPQAKAPHLVAAEILSASRSANDAQMAAIGRALARKVRELAERYPAESRAISTAVMRVQQQALQRSFNSALGSRVPGVAVPTGPGGGWLDTTSPN